MDVRKVLVGMLAVFAGVIVGLCTFQMDQSRRQAAALAERDTSLADSERARRALSAENQRLSATIDELAGRLKTVTRERDELAAVKLQARPSAPVSGAKTEAAAPAGDDMAAMRQGIRGFFGRMLQNPQMREMVRTRQAERLDRWYGGLYERLKLSPETRDALKELLSDRQMALMQAGMDAWQDGALDRDALAARTAEVQEQTDADVLALLGEDGFAEYQTYASSLGERQYVSRFASGLGADAALDAAQEEQLTQLLVDAREDVGAAPLWSGRGPGPPGAQPITAPEEVASHLQRRQQQVAVVNERTADILTEPQRAAFVAYQERQLEREKAGLEMVRHLFQPPEGQ